MELQQGEKVTLVFKDGADYEGVEVVDSNIIGLWVENELGNLVWVMWDALKLVRTERRWDG